MSTIVYALLGGFALGVGLGALGVVSHRSRARNRLMECYVTSPSSESIRLEWVEPPEGRTMKVPSLEEDEEHGVVPLDGSFFMNGMTGPAILVDSDTWKPLDPQDEVADFPQLYPIDGNHLREIIRDERVEEWQAHQSGALGDLPNLLVKSVLALGLLLLVVIAMLVSGFDMMG